MYVNHSHVRHFPSKAFKQRIVQDIEELLPKLDNQRMITYKQIAYKYKYSPSSIQAIYQNHRQQLSKGSIKESKSSLATIDQSKTDINDLCNVQEKPKLEDPVPEFQKQLTAIYDQNKQILTGLNDLKSYNKQIQQFIQKCTLGYNKSRKQKQQKSKDHHRRNPQEFLEKMLAQEIEAIQTKNNNNQLVVVEYKKLKHLIKKQGIVQQQIKNYIDNQEYQQEVKKQNE